VAKGNEGVEKLRQIVLLLAERITKLLILRFSQTALTPPKNFFNSLKWFQPKREAHLNSSRELSRCRYLVRVYHSGGSDAGRR
jgi:hypothetical protein